MTTSGIDWAHLAFSVLAGLGVLLIGIGFLRLCTGVADLLRRLNGTLDEVDRQISALSAPVVETLSHVGGIADTADSTVARLTAVVGALETVSASVAKTSTLVSSSIGPSIVNVGATVTGVTAGIRKLLTGRRGARPDPDLGEIIP